MNFPISRLIAWAIWAAASVFYAYQYFLRVMPSVMLENLLDRFGIDAAAFGQFSGIYYIGYSLMHLPLGIMLDRFGPRPVMAGSILLSALGMLPLIFFDSWAFSVSGRLLVGMGSSAAILSVFKVIRIGFHEKVFSRMLSFSVMIGLVGAIFGGGPLHAMCEGWGARLTMQIFAFFGLLLAIASYLLIPKISTSSNVGVIASIKEVLSNRTFLWIAFCSGFLVGPLEGFADVWGSAFLSHVYDYDKTMATSLPSVIFIGMCFGAPLLTFIAERTKSYFGSIFVAAFLMAFLFILLLTLRLSLLSLITSFSMIGICCAYQILAIYKASSYIKEELSGVATAFVNMIIMAFGYGFHTFIGKIIDFSGGPQSAKAISLGVSLIPIALIIGGLGFLPFLYRTQKIPSPLSASKRR